MVRPMPGARPRCHDSRRAVLAAELRRLGCNQTVAVARSQAKAPAPAGDMRATWSAVATVVSSTLLKTDSWVRMLGRVPVPWRPSYGQELSRRLMVAWRNGEQVANTATAICRSRSVKGARTAAETYTGVSS